MPGLPVWLMSSGTNPLEHRYLLKCLDGVFSGVGTRLVSGVGA